MNDSYRAVSHGQPATYQIQVQGLISERWVDWFDGMTITGESSGGELVITTLVGEIEDQAALMGLMQKLYSLGHSLLEVRRLQPEGDDPRRDS